MEPFGYNWSLRQEIFLEYTPNVELKRDVNKAS